MCSTNSTLTRLYVYDNPMSVEAHKAIDLEVALCQMRNPTVTEIGASHNGFDDQDAIKIGEGLRFVLHIIPILFVIKKLLFHERHFFDAARIFCGR